MVRRLHAPMDLATHRRRPPHAPRPRSPGRRSRTPQSPPTAPPRRDVTSMAIAGPAFAEGGEKGEEPKFDAIYCANMLHIAPWPTCAALMQGAARHLRSWRVADHLRALLRRRRPDRRRATRRSTKTCAPAMPHGASAAWKTWRPRRAAQASRCASGMRCLRTTCCWCSACAPGIMPATKSMNALTLAGTWFGWGSRRTEGRSRQASPSERLQRARAQVRVDSEIDHLGDSVACKAGPDLGSCICDCEVSAHGHLHLLIATPELPIEGPAGRRVDGVDAFMAVIDQILRRRSAGRVAPGKTARPQSGRADCRACDRPMSKRMAAQTVSRGRIRRSPGPRGRFGSPASIEEQGGLSGTGPTPAPTQGGRTRRRTPPGVFR
jgi:hypothetical protein